MVVDLLNYIAEQVNLKNPNFDKYTGVAIQLEDGRVYKFTTDNEKTYCGLSDSDGIAFYVKVNPLIEFTRGRQITSTKQSNEGSVSCTLVAYQVNSELNVMNWANKLVESLISVTFDAYTGTEKHLKIEIQNVNFNDQTIFRDETGKSFEWDNALRAVSINYIVKFTSFKYDCTDCTIFDLTYC